MSLLWFSATCLVVFALLEFWWISSLRKRIRKDPTASAVARAARLVVYRYVRSVALVAAATALLALAAVFLLRMEGTPRLTVQAVREATQRFVGVKQSLDAARPYWFAGAAALLSVTMGVYLYRRRAFQLNAAFDAAHSAEIDRQINAMQNEPTWWDLPPNPLMIQISERVRQLQGSLAQQPESRRPAYEAQIEELHRIHLQMNVMRRVDVKLDPDAIEDPAPENWREWLGGLLASPRVAGQVGRGTRMLHRANLALLVLGLIGFQSQAVRQVVDDRLVEFSDLEVHFTRLDELKRRVEEIRKADTPSAQSAVAQKFDEIAKEVERVKTASLETKQPPPPPDRPQSPPEDLARVTEEVKARQAEIRRQEEVIAEVRNHTAERPRGPDGEPPPAPGSTPSDKPPTKPGPKLAELKARLDRVAEGPADRARTLRDRIDKLHEAIKGEDPKAPIRSRLEKLSSLESQFNEARDTALAEVEEISGELDRLTGAKGREAEVAALRDRVAPVRDEIVAKVEGPARELRRLRQDLEAEVAQRTAGLEARRQQVGSLAGEAQQVARAEAAMPTLVEDARLRIAAAEGRAEWRATAPAPAQADAARLAHFDEETTQAVNKVARAYEEGLTETRLVRDAVARPDPRTAYRMRSMATRDAILTQAQARAPTERVRPPAMADVANLTDAQRALARDAQGVFRPDEPRTWAGDRMKAELAERARAVPEFRARLVAKAKSLGTGVRGAFARLGEGAFAGKPFWREIALSALNLVSPQVDATAGLIGDALDHASREAVVHFEEVSRYKFLNEIRGDASVESAVKTMAAQDADLTLGRTQEYVSKLGSRAKEVGSTVERLAPYEPAIDVPFDRGVNLPKATEVARDRAADREAEILRVAGDALKNATPEDLARLRVQLTEAQSEAIINYTDHFPSQNGMDLTTPRGRLVETARIGGDSTFHPGDLADWSPSPSDSNSHANSGGGGRSASRPGSQDSDGGSRPTAGSGPAPRVVRAPTVVAEAPRPSRIMRPSAPWFTPAAGRSFSSATRARSFTRLRGFARVGGVLIGREPDAAAGQGAAVDLVGLRWEVAGDQVRLIALARDGKEVRSRPFRRDTVALALAYVSDGRPTAVTMVEANPLQELRILLHPALVDTPLGRHVVQIDRLVDTYVRTRPGQPYYCPWRTQEAEAVQGQFMLYERAWALRLGVLADEFAKLGSDAERLKERADNLLRQTGDDPRGRAIVSLALGDPAALSDEGRSVLVAKPEYFDAELVRKILAGVAGETLDEFDVRVRKACQVELKEARDAAGSLFPGRTSVQKVLRRWQTPAPTFTIWSGVREVPFVSTLDDVFPTQEREARPVVDFMIQVAFTSPPYLAEGGPRDTTTADAEEELLARFDKKPWEFPAIAARVREAVASALEEPANAKDKETLEVVSEFVSVQRFFRAGFSGGLGRDFPVELLAELHDTLTAGPTPAPARTPRWNVQPGLYEAQLEKVISAARANMKKAEGGVGPWSEKLTAALDDLGERCAQHKEHQETYVDALAKAGATAGTDEGAAARRRSARLKAWDEFQAWDRTWEEGVVAAVENLKTLSDQIKEADDVGLPSDADRCLAVLNGPPDVANSTAQIAGALRMRRALNVAEDDRAQLLDEDAGRPRRVEAAPARPPGASPAAGAHPPTAPPG